MHRIDGPGHVNGAFVAEDPELLRPPTEITAAWLNAVQEEPLAVIEAAGIVPSALVRNQLLRALRSAGVFETAAEGDNTTRAATTAFVKSALGSFGGTDFVTAGGTTLTAQSVGRLTAVAISAAGGTINVPQAFTVGVGKVLPIINAGSTVITVVLFAGDVIDDGAITRTSIVLLPGECLHLTKSTSSTIWYDANSSTGIGGVRPGLSVSAGPLTAVHANRTLTISATVPTDIELPSIAELWNGARLMIVNPTGVTATLRTKAGEVIEIGAASVSGWELAPGDGLELAVTAGAAYFIASSYRAALSTELATPGDVKYVAKIAAPSGWLKANGAAVSRTTYAALFGAIGTAFGIGDGSTTFNLPDLRGEWVRGWDDGRGVDAGRVLGSAQTFQNAGHTHGVTDPGHAHDVQLRFSGSGAATYAVSASGQTGGAHTLLAPGTNSKPTGMSIQESGGTEVRVRNVALLAVIKF